MPRRVAAALAATLLFSAPAALAQSDAGWQDYTDPNYGFFAQLPMGLFVPVDAGDRPGITLQEIGGEAQLSLYGGPADGMTRDGLEARLEAGDQINTITYRAGGESWFVLSGFYDQSDRGEQTIYYTKVMFSPDHETFSAFEISFPAEDKPRLEALVEHFEDNFTRPS
jgi:hypothetical protein